MQIGGTKDHLIRVFDSPAQVDARHGTRCSSTQAAPTPFMRHEYLLALHASDSAVPETGWANQLLFLHRRASWWPPARCT